MRIAVLFVRRKLSYGYSYSCIILVGCGAPYSLRSYSALYLYRYGNAAAARHQTPGTGLDGKAA
jgi:hypothetical protein